MVTCGQSQARAADGEERLLEARSLQASAERQAEQALACLQGLAAGAKEDSMAVDVLQVHNLTVCTAGPCVWSDHGGYSLPCHVTHCAGMQRNSDKSDPRSPCRAQTELAAERELRMRTEAEAAQSALRAERKVGELSRALDDAAADVQAARQEVLQSTGRAAAHQVPLGGAYRNPCPGKGRDCILVMTPGVKMSQR